MSGTQTPPPAGAAADPSMEDILASIRRILSEDDAPATTSPAPEPAKPEDDVLDLDASMMIAESPADPPAPVVVAVNEPVAPQAPVKAPTSSALLAPETEAAVASSMGGLLRTLIAEREQVAVYRGGPTIEDLVREEIRPLLKQWLDANLQPVVERLVRAEIERVVGRGVT